MGDIRVLLSFLALGVAILAVVAVQYAPPHFVARTTGHAIGQFVHQDEDGPPAWLVSVRLNEGGTISLAMPKNQQFRTDLAMNIDVYEHGFGPITWKSYRFKGYADAVK